MSYTPWTWALRDALGRDPKEQPPAGQVAVIVMLASHLNPETGCGWVSRGDLLRVLPVSKDTVTAAAQWAIGHLFLRRLVTGRRHGDRGTASLFVLSNPDQPWPDDSPEAVTTAPGPASQGPPSGSLGNSQRPSSRRPEAVTTASGSPYKDYTSRGTPVEDRGPLAGSAAPEAATTAPGNLPDLLGGLLPAAVGGALVPAPAAVAAPELTAQTLVAEWIDNCPRRPPGRVVGHVSRELKVLLEDDKISYEEVRAGLGHWHRRRLHPAALASCVHEVMNGAAPGGGVSRTDERVLLDIQRIERYRQQVENG